MPPYTWKKIKPVSRAKMRLGHKEHASFSVHRCHKGCRGTQKEEESITLGGFIIINGSNPKSLLSWGEYASTERLFKNALNLFKMLGGEVILVKEMMALSYSSSRWLQFMEGAGAASTYIPTPWLCTYLHWWPWCKMSSISVISSIVISTLLVVLCLVRTSDIPSMATYLGLNWTVRSSQHSQVCEGRLPLCLQWEWPHPV